MNNKKLISNLLYIIKPYKSDVVITIILAFLISLISVFDSFLLSYSIDNILVSNTKATLFTICLIMLLVVLLNVSLTGIKNLLIQKISYSMDIELMQNFYEKVFKLPFVILEKHKSGELTSRMNDVKKVQGALSYGLISIITNIITFVIVGIVLIKINKEMFFISCIFIFILGIIALAFGKYYTKRYPIDMEIYSDLQAFTTESFSGIETIKAMSATSLFFNEYKKRKLRSMVVSWGISEKCIIQDSLITIISRVSSILVLIIGFYNVINGSMSLGQIASFLTLSAFFSSSVSALISLQSRIQEAYAALKRLYEILTDEIIEGNGTCKPADNQVLLIYDNITFSYMNDKSVLECFYLSIKNGEWISFIGKTGCGKTTLIKLLLRFYEPKCGKILWNDIDLKEIDRQWLYSKIAYIPQDIVLFAGTIFDNITMFNSLCKKDEVIEITKMVGIYDKIASLPEGFETTLGERGTSLSGGEKQKIAIARALVKRPILLIFDEATSNLDVMSEKQIVQIIKNLHKNGLTIITIAHRLTTIKESDKIIVLDRGKIVEEGNHAELMKRNGIYREMLE